MKRRMRKSISMFILMSFIFSMFVENLVFATVIPIPEEAAISSEIIEEEIVTESADGIPLVTITNSANEITRNEVISYTAGIGGLTEQVSNLSITYSLAGDRTRTIPVYSWNSGGNITGSIQVNNYTYPGLYEIDYVDVYTETSNYRVYNEIYYPNEELTQSFVNTEFTVYGTYGGVMPELSVSVNDTELVEGETLTITMDADTSIFHMPFDSVDLFYNVNYKIVEFHLPMIEPGRYEADIPVESYFESGEYRIERMVFNSDEYPIYINNSEGSNDEYSKDLSGGTFSVAGTVPDVTSPELVSLSVSQNVVRPNESGTMTIQATDDLSGVMKGMATFRSEDGGVVYVDLTKIGDELVGPITKRNLSSGQYNLVNVMIQDYMSNQSNYYADTLNEYENYGTKWDFSSYFFQVSDQIVTVPDFSIELSQKELSLGDELKVIYNNLEEFMWFSQVEFIYVNDENPSDESTLYLNSMEESIFTYNQVVDQYSRSGQFSLKKIRLRYGSSVIEIGDTLLSSDSEFTADLSAGNYTISSPMDNFIPEFSLTTDKTSYSTNDYSVNFNLDISNLDIDVNNIRLELIVEDDPTWIESVNMWNDYMNGGYQGSKYNVNDMKSGKYDLSKIYITHNNEEFEYRNAKYHTEGNLIDFTGALFEVTGTMAGYQPGVEMSVSPKEATVGDEVIIDVFVDDNVIQFDNLRVSYSVENVISEEKKIVEKKLEKISSTHFQYKMIVGEYQLSGAYELSELMLESWDYSINITDAEHNPNDKYTLDLAQGDFMVSDTKEDNELPRVTGIDLPEAVYTGSNLDIIVHAEDDLSGLSEGFIFLSKDQYNTHVAKLVLEDGNLVGNFYVGNDKDLVWQVEYVELTDNAGNTSVYWNEETGEMPENAFPLIADRLSFRLMERYLKDVDFKLEQTVYGPNEDIEIHLNMTSDLESANYGFLYYTGPDQEGMQVYFSKISGNLYIANHRIPYNMASGEYKLSSIHMFGFDGDAVIRHGDSNEEGTMDLSHGNLVIQGTGEDETKPELHSVFVGKYIVDESGYQSFTVLADDNLSGVANGEITLRNLLSDKTTTVYLENKGKGILKGSTNFGQFSAPGIWIIDGVTIMDYANNESVYRNDKNQDGEGIAFDFSSAEFKLTNTVLDEVPPSYTSSELNKNSVALNEEFEYRFDIKDNLSRVSRVYLMLEDENGEEYSIYSNSIFDSAQIIIRNTFAKMQMPAGKYRVKAIVAMDGAGNTTMIRSENEVMDEDADRIIHADLNHLNIEVKEVVSENTDGYVTDISVNPLVAKYGEKITITVTPGLKSVDAERMTLLYNSNYHGDKTLIRLHKQSDGTFVGVYENQYSPELVDFNVEMLRVVTKAGTFDFYDERTPYSFKLIDLSGGDFKLEVKEQDEFTIPGLENLRINSGEYTIDDRVAIDLGVDLSTFKNMRLSINYRINGEAYNIFTTDIQSQHAFHKVGKYDIPGIYTIDSIDIYGENYARILNKKYYGNEENAVEFNEQFTVYGTVPDYIAPKFISLVSDKKEAGMGTTVTYTLKAEDLESGIAYGVMVMEDPNGRESEKELNLYMNPMGELQGTWTIEDETSAGEWKPRSVRVFDKANNLTIVYNALSNEVHSFEGRMITMQDAHVEVVTSMKVDTTPPEFKGLTYVTLSDLDYMVIDATEVESGLKYIRAYYENAEGGFEMMVPVFKFEGKYYGEIYKPEYAKAGEFNLLQVYLEDYAGNSVTYFHSETESGENILDMSSAKYTLERAHYDNLKINEITLDKNNAVPGDEITLTMTLNNPLIQMFYIEASFVSEDGLYNDYLMMYQNYDGSYSGSLEVSEYDPAGTYHLENIFLQDMSGTDYLVFEDSATMSSYEAENEIYYALSDVKYSVSGTVTDREAPKVEDINIYKKENLNVLDSLIGAVQNVFTGSGQEYKSGDTVIVEVSGTDDVSGISQIEMYYSILDKTIPIFVELEKVEEGKYRGEFTIEEKYPSGDWIINYISIYDAAGNVHEPQRNYNFNGIPGYDKLNFKVTDTIKDVNGPILDSIQVDVNEVTAGEMITYTIKATDDVSGIGTVHMVLVGTLTGDARYVDFTEVSEDTYTIMLSSEDLTKDIWRVQSLVLADRSDNFKIYANIDYPVTDADVRKDWNHLDVKVNTVDGIEISSEPVKKTYLVGEELDLSGIEVLFKEDGRVRILNDSEWSVSGFDSSKAIENQIVTITYGNYNATFKITVTEPETEKLSVLYRTHVQNQGWQDYVADGAMSGTEGAGLRLEGIEIKIDGNSDLGVKYATHIQNIGWQDYVADGLMSGTSERSLRLEAIKMELTGEDRDAYDIYYRVHAEGFGWMGWAKNGENAGTSGYSYRLEAIEIRLMEKGVPTDLPMENAYRDKMKESKISYRTHVQNKGWQNFVGDGVVSGTEGAGLRLEGIEIKVDGNPDLGVRYSTHVQNAGWQDYVTDGITSGTLGQALRLEAIKLELTGKDSDKFDIYYRVHAERFGWLDWAKNGSAAGTAGYGYRLEAIEIKMVAKGTVPELPTANAYQSTSSISDVSYRTHVQNIGWQNYVADGKLSGTSGQALRLEGINIKLGDHLPSGSIEYTTHVESIGWLNVVKDGAMSGTENRGLRLEAIRINLTGEVAKQYDVYYRAHAQNLGWMDWVKNGEDAGTSGFGYRLEGIEVMMVEKGAIAP